MPLTSPILLGCLLLRASDSYAVLCPIPGIGKHAGNHKATSTCSTSPLDSWGRAQAPGCLGDSPGSRATSRPPGVQPHLCQRTPLPTRSGGSEVAPKKRPSGRRLLPRKISHPRMARATASADQSTKHRDVTGAASTIGPDRRARFRRLRDRRRETRPALTPT